MTARDRRSVTGRRRVGAGRRLRVLRLAGAALAVVAALGGTRDARASAPPPQPDARSPAPSPTAREVEVEGPAPMPSLARSSGAPVPAGEGTPRSVQILSVRVEGNEQISRRLIDNILESEGIEPGIELIVPDDARVYRARSRLAATGYFGSVNLRLVPRREDGGPARAELVVELVARPSLELSRLYAGSSRLTPFRGGVELVERNFLGRALEVGGGMIWGTVPPAVPGAQRQQGYRLSFDAPQISATKLGLGGKLYFMSASEAYQVSGRRGDPDPSRYRSADYTRIGGSLGGTWRVTPTLRLGADYRFEWVDALVPTDPVFEDADGRSRPIDLDLRPGGHRLTTTAFHLSWDGRDAVESLGSGGRIALDLELASPALGSQYEYAKVVAGGAYSFRLPWRHFVTPSILGGHVIGDAPRFERFYPGDAHDWTPGREFGMTWTTRAPIDTFGLGLDEVGLASIFGRADLEYGVPLFQRSRTRFLQGGYFFVSTGVFAVAGDAEERRARIERGQVAAPLGLNADLGVRLETSIGTIDLGVGNILRRAPL